MSNRAGGQGLGDFYLAFRRNNLDDTSWDEVRSVPELNTASDEFGPSGYENPATGVVTFFFNSDRPGGSGGHDIYISDLGADGKFTTPVPVGDLNSPVNDTWPSVRPDGLEMFLISNRAGTLGGNDIWVASRGSLTDRWSTPVNLGSPVNTASVEGRSFPTADGTRLVFFSNRTGGTGGQDLYETTRTRTAVIPIIGSVTGVGGTRFSTVAEISNPSSTPISGVLIFRPAGQPASSSDPRIPYNLGAFETRAFADLMASFGLQGIGSLEIAPTTGAAPSANVRIEDGGSIIIPRIRTEDVLVAGSRGVLVTPSDMTRFRFNVGIRTLASGVTMTVTVHDQAGGSVRTTTRTVGPNTILQMTASDFIGGPVAARQLIVITIESGSAVVFGSSVGTNPQASTLQIATRSP